MNPAHRVEDLWFEDGNLVIEAGNSQFRVYRGVLAARSPVFQDMLSFPQPPDSELVEGCPVVRFYDSAAEVTAFLKSIFDSGFFLPYPFPTDFDTVAGTLRLSHKYEVDYLRRRALVHLASYYPTALSDFDEVWGGSQSPLKRPSWNRPTLSAYRIFVIQLAREVDALWILPSAFYSLAFSFVAQDIGIFHGTIYNGVPTSLSQEDQKAVMMGYRMQCTSTVEDVLRFLFSPVDVEGCTSTPECHKLRLEALTIHRGFRKFGTHNPLFLWNWDEWGLLNDLCPTCLSVLKHTHEEARQKFWDDLPAIYGLPQWEKLEEMRSDAIGADLDIYSFDTLSN
ncbi:hypothetical protein C8R43DRAFT_1016277 [Mycena crocata]|nr:hypothetical protein C8R43DRAFT_1016277 [Mycena crocata]